MPGQDVALICFSPTRTTRETLEAVARGLGGEAECIDLTPPAAEELAIDPLAQSQIVILGVPVYSGRVPEVAARRLRRIQSEGGPVVLVVVYGNRAFEDALLELRDIAVALGFRPVAAGAFLGEHSFATAEAPLATGRPDAQDLAAAETFGTQVRERLAASGDLPEPAIPGNRPYRDRGPSLVAAPETDAAACALCGVCAEVCPVGVVGVDGVVVTDASGCIQCCACVKACPTGARAMRAERIEQIRQRLLGGCLTRRGSETFF